MWGWGCGGRYRCIRAMSHRWTSHTNSTPAMATPLLTLRLNALDIGAAKRGRTGHYGLVNNSSSPIKLVALSRLVRSADVSNLEDIANSAAGKALLAALRRVTLSVASASGQADPQLNATQIETFFNTPASTIHSQHLYATHFSLPSKMPHPFARKLLDELLDVLSAARASATAVLEQLINPSLSPSPNHVKDGASIEQLVATVGDAMAARFPTMPLPPRTTAPPPTVLPNPAPLPVTSSTQSTTNVPTPADMSSHNMALDPNASLAVNFERQLAARWGRSLSVAESTTLASALEQSLDLMQPGDPQAGQHLIQQLLHGPTLTALTHSAAAQLWACGLEVLERDLSSAEEVADALQSASSAITAILFAEGLLI